MHNECNKRDIYSNCEGDDVGVSDNGFTYDFGNQPVYNKKKDNLPTAAYHNNRVRRLLFNTAEHSSHYAMASQPKKNVFSEHLN